MKTNELSRRLGRRGESERERACRLSDECVLMCVRDRDGEHYWGNLCHDTHTNEFACICSYTSLCVMTMSVLLISCTRSEAVSDP